ncbi:MAG: hypothetical protein AB9M60_01295, partial [Leptothrix sp. (in: b-proteobacteria)]
MTPLPITHATVSTALGAGCAAHRSAIAAGRSGLQPCRFEDVTLPGWIGVVDGVDAVQLLDGFANHDCRNNRLAWLGLQQDGFLDAVAAARARWGAPRVAVLLGTSTSGILQTELAYRRRGPDGALPADFRYATSWKGVGVCNAAPTQGSLGVTGAVAGVAWIAAGPTRAVAVLVVATPCPLILAVPVALSAGLSRG